MARRMGVRAQFEVVPSIQRRAVRRIGIRPQICYGLRQFERNMGQAKPHWGVAVDQKPGLVFGRDSIPKPDEPESNSLRREGATPTEQPPHFCGCGSRALATNDLMTFLNSSKKLQRLDLSVTWLLCDAKVATR